MNIYIQLYNDVILYKKNFLILPGLLKNYLKCGEWGGEAQMAISCLIIQSFSLELKKQTLWILPPAMCL